jgi:nucleoside-diphosphate-sugar epimerase
MKILVIGAAGMVGRKLVERLAKDPGALPFDRAELIDVVEPPIPAGLAGKATARALDLTAPGSATEAVASRPDLIFHLAAVVSGEAESDFEKGYRVNLDATRALFETIRAAAYRPRVVFTSSIAVFGGPYPPRIGDEFLNAPLSSYGTQKAIAELLLTDYTRRGFLDGIGLRFPTIVIRPGKPNLAASGFFSNILREPLSGQEAVLPVDDSVRHWFASPRAAVGFLLHAARLDLARLGPRRNLTLPGLSATIGDEIDALRRAAGEKAVRLIRREPDARIRALVAGWPADFDARRATELGFAAEKSFDEIVRAHIEDELGGRVGG